MDKGKHHDARPSFFFSRVPWHLVRWASVLDFLYCLGVEAACPDPDPCIYPASINGDEVDNCVRRCIGQACVAFIEVRGTHTVALAFIFRVLLMKCKGVRRHHQHLCMRLGRWRLLLKFFRPIVLHSVRVLVHDDPDSYDDAKQNHTWRVR